MKLILKNTSLKFEMVKEIEPFGGSSNAFANQYIDTIKITVTGNFTFSGKVWLRHYYNENTGHMVNWQLFQTEGKSSDTRVNTMLALLGGITFPLADSTKYIGDAVNGSSGSAAEGSKFKLEVYGDLTSYYSAVEAAKAGGDNSATEICDSSNKVNIL